LDDVPGRGIACQGPDRAQDPPHRQREVPLADLSMSIQQIKIAAYATPAIGADVKGDPLQVADTTP
jgi:hypothetical protein